MSNLSSQEDLSVSQLKSQLLTARNEIHNLRQQLVALKHVHQKECDFIYNKLENWRCVECRNRQCNGSSVEVASSSDRDCDFKGSYIGVISTHFPEKRGTPRQPGICSNVIAKLILNNDVFTNPDHALEGLQEFSHMWILFHFHQNNSTHTKAKVAPPRLNGIRTGVFATRSPHRPCPIGLSLVKIDRIMDNTIYFSGVDMVDRTPVLDIKPYIPQYDNPEINNFYFPGDCYSEGTHSMNGSMSELDTDNSNNVESLSAQQVTETLESMNVRVMDGEENSRGDHILGAASSGELHSRSEESFFARSNSRMGEREAPDGEEEGTPSSSQTARVIDPMTPEGQVRVPSWIDQPPVSTLTVLFKDRALSQLCQLGPEGEEKKGIITNVLREDPRSVYLRERWGSHCYVFRIAELYVSCKFNDASHTVTVYQVFQNEASEAHE